MVAFDPVFPAGVQQRGGSHYVGADKALRIHHGTIHMTLGGKVHHHVRLFLLKQVKYKLPVRDIAPDKMIVGLILHRL